MGTPGFVITWADHHKIIQPKFYNFYLNQMFVDVVIQCHDANLKAHKVILAGGSKFFEKALSSGKEVVRVADISADIMGIIFQFLYLGRTAAEEGEMEALRRACQQLEIFGLIELPRDSIGQDWIEINNEDDFKELLQKIDRDEQEQEEPIQENLPPGSFLLDSAKINKVVEASRKALENMRKSAHITTGKDKGDALIGASEDDVAAQALVSELQALTPRPPMAAPVPYNDMPLMVMDDSHGEYLIQDNGENCYFLEDLDNLTARNRVYESDESTQEASDVECLRSASESEMM